MNTIPKINRLNALRTIILWQYMNRRKEGEDVQTENCNSEQVAMKPEYMQKIVSTQYLVVRFHLAPSNTY